MFGGKEPPVVVVSDDSSSAPSRKQLPVVVVSDDSSPAPLREQLPGSCIWVTSNTASGLKDGAESLKEKCGRSYSPVYPSQMKLDFGQSNLGSRPDSLTSYSSPIYHPRSMFDFGSLSTSLNRSRTRHHLSSRPHSLSRDTFSSLLVACAQSTTSTFSDVLENFRGSECIVKVGEGTYGEAFKVGEAVLKIVPFDGADKINGEVPKKSEELLEEVLLSNALNHLRGCGTDPSYACTSFIETTRMQVCHGPYDDALIKAWEEWAAGHGSGNDNPKFIPENQMYVVFVQEHGGLDLESFKILKYNEARSIIVQATLALAVAEAAFEFEHRDLHWGNILVRRGASENLCFTLDGRKINVKTFGLLISIIDFGFSRLKTEDEDILFLDLSADPEIFEGPKNDEQFDTYRKMKEVTSNCWKGSYPKTNVLWLQYLVHILTEKKSYVISKKDGRELKKLKRRLGGYKSAKEAVEDEFISLLIK